MVLNILLNPDENSRILSRSHFMNSADGGGGFRSSVRAGGCLTVGASGLVTCTAGPVTAPEGLGAGMPLGRKTGGVEGCEFADTCRLTVGFPLAPTVVHAPPDG